MSILKNFNVTEKKYFEQLRCPTHPVNRPSPPHGDTLATPPGARSGSHSVWRPGRRIVCRGERA
jgi:hypothetical protein